MKFLLLIYDDEKRWNKLGKPDYGSELEEYRAFGKEFAKSILGGHALEPTTAAKTVRVRNTASDHRRAVCRDERATCRILSRGGMHRGRSDCHRCQNPRGAARLDRGAADTDIFLVFDVDFSFLERRSFRRRLPRTPNSVAEGALP